MDFDMQQTTSTPHSVSLMAQTQDFPTIHLVSKSERHIPCTTPVKYFTLKCVKTRSCKNFTEATHRFKCAAMDLQGYDNAWKAKRAKHLVNRQLQHIEKYTAILDEVKQQYLKELYTGKRASDETRCKFNYYSSKLKTVSAKKQLRFSNVEQTCLIPKLDTYYNREQVKQAALNRSSPDRVSRVHITKVCLSFSELFERSFDYDNDIGVHPYYTNWKMSMREFLSYQEYNLAQELALDDEMRKTFRKNMKSQHSIVPEAIAIEKELAEAGRTGFNR